jgi:hypothetical protein
MVHRVVIASMFVTATAYAQAPGEVAPAAPAAPAEPAPCAPHESVMANRWAVGLSIGSLGLAPKDAPDAQTQFAVGQLALRFRATLHLELEAAFGGGREQLHDGSDGSHQVATGVLALRYRFAPEARWNWWLMGGIGSLAVTGTTPTDQQRRDAQRPLGELGIGVERRFRRFALDAELRAIGVGPLKQPPAMTVPVSGTGTSMATSTPPASTSADRLSGGQLTIGASYYF